MANSQFYIIDLASLKERPEEEQTRIAIEWLYDNSHNSVSDYYIQNLAKIPNLKNLVRKYIIDYPNLNRKLLLLHNALDPLHALGKFFWVQRDSSEPDIFNGNLGILYEELCSLAQSCPEAFRLAKEVPLFCVPNLKENSWPQFYWPDDSSNNLLNQDYFDELLILNKDADPEKIYNLINQPNHSPEVIWSKFFLTGRYQRYEIFKLLYGYFNVLEYLLDRNYPADIIGGFTRQIMNKCKTSYFGTYTFPYKFYGNFLSLGRKLSAKGIYLENWKSEIWAWQNLKDDAFLDKEFSLDTYLFNLIGLNDDEAKIAFNLIASDRLNTSTIICRFLTYKPEVREYINKIPNLYDRRQQQINALDEKTPLGYYFHKPRYRSEPRVDSGNLLKIAAELKATESALQLADKHHHLNELIDQKNQQGENAIANASAPPQEFKAVEVQPQQPSLFARFFNWAPKKDLVCIEGDNKNDLLKISVAPISFGENIQNQIVSPEVEEQKPVILRTAYPNLFKPVQHASAIITPQTLPPKEQTIEKPASDRKIQSLYA